MVDGWRGEVFGQRPGLGSQGGCSTLVAISQSGTTQLVKKHAAVMARLLGRDQPAFCCLREGFPCRRPVPLARLQIEAALDRPACPRTQCRGARGETKRAASIAGTQRLV